MKLSQTTLRYEKLPSRNFNSTLLVHRWFIVTYCCIFLPTLHKFCCSGSNPLAHSFKVFKNREEKAVNPDILCICAKTLPEEGINISFFTISPFFIFPFGFCLISGLSQHSFQEFLCSRYSGFPPCLDHSSRYLTLAASGHGAGRLLVLQITHKFMCNNLGGFRFLSEWLNCEIRS